MAELTPKQARFVDEYLIDLNATQAAIRAGYSEKTARQIGEQLLSKLDIRSAIETKLSERSQKTEITAERVLKEIAAMAFYDPADLVEIMRPLEHGEQVDDGGIIEIDGKRFIMQGIIRPQDIKKLPEPIRRAIVGWGWDKNQNFTLKIADKSKALDQLARHLSLYNDKLELTGVDQLAERLARAAQRNE